MATTKTEATVEDLYNAPDDGNYELVNGKLVRMPPTGFGPGRTSGSIYRSLSEYEEATGSGYALPDGVAFIVNLPNRRSFSPDTAFTLSAPENTERFADGAPIFAVEVRSENDHGPRMDRAYADKRADYFAAGTEVVWDVNPRTQIIASYYREQPDAPIAFRRGEIAHAEPVLPGWRIPVDQVFRAP
jgi:Uma2 family endonuclease